MVRIRILLRIQRASVEGLPSVCQTPNWASRVQTGDPGLGDCLFKLEIDNLCLIFKNIFY